MGMRFPIDAFDTVLTLCTRIIYLLFEAVSSPLSSNRDPFHLTSYSIQSRFKKSVVGILALVLFLSPRLSSVLQWEQG